MINQENVNRQAEARFTERKGAREAISEQLDSLKAGKRFDWKKVERATRLAERARRMGLFDAAGALLRDPEDMETGNQIFEQIIDANNLLGVTFLSDGAQKARAVGRIALPVAGGTRLGTGFLVSPRVMMTNNHVLGDAIEAANAALEFDFFERDGGTIGPVIRFRLQPGALFVTDIPLDFSLVAVETTNAAGVVLSDRGWFPLVGPSGKAIVGERVSIIQHPNGDPQKVTLHDNKIVDFSGDFLHYETDTMGGSSGSPVLNIDWDLAALHHAAVGNANEGIRISSIVAKLQEIFAQEGTEHRDAALVAELMGAPRPPSPRRSGQTEPPSDVNFGEPRVNADGTVAWVVPVRVTLGVGEPIAVADRAPASGTGTTAAVSPVTGSDLSEPPLDDPDLRDAIEALEATEGRVYYSKTNDTKARDDYYPNLDGLDKTQLYGVLSALLADTHTTPLTYKKARLTHLYPWIDRREDSSRQLRGIYSNKVFDALEVIRREAVMERRRERAIRERMLQEAAGGIDEAFLEELEAAYPFNCEHVVPQSWFNKRKQPKTDLHHLFTCEWGCNSFRGKRAYFDFQTEAFRDDCGESGTGQFEPKGGKGAVARATLYFLCRYPRDIADSNKEMPKDRLETLIRWANGDKVDRWERHRNAEIQKVQGNRNPLIDFPELVDKIDFELGWA